MPHGSPHAQCSSSTSATDTDAHCIPGTCDAPYRPPGGQKDCGNANPNWSQLPKRTRIHFRHKSDWQPSMNRRIRCKRHPKRLTLHLPYAPRFYDTTAIRANVRTPRQGEGGCNAIPDTPQRQSERAKLQLLSGHAGFLYRRQS